MSFNWSPLSSLRAFQRPRHTPRNVVDNRAGWVAQSQVAGSVTNVDIAVNPAQVQKDLKGAQIRGVFAVSTGRPPVQLSFSTSNAGLEYWHGELGQGLAARFGIATSKGTIWLEAPGGFVAPAPDTERGE